MLQTNTVYRKEYFHRQKSNTILLSEFTISRCRQHLFKQNICDLWWHNGRSKQHADSLKFNMQLKEIVKNKKDLFGSHLYWTKTIGWLVSYSRIVHILNFIANYQKDVKNSISFVFILSVSLLLFIYQCRPTVQLNYRSDDSAREWFFAASESSNKKFWRGLRSVFFISYGPLIFLIHCWHYFNLLTNGVHL